MTNIPWTPLKYEELVEFVESVISPKGKGFTPEELNRRLLIFCANCPDPAAAMGIVIETMAPLTAREMVDGALACSKRDVSLLPESELPLTHPLRHMEMSTQLQDEMRHPKQR